MLVNRRASLIIAALAAVVHAGCLDKEVNAPREPGIFKFSPNHVYAGAEVKIIGTDAYRLNDYWLAATDPPTTSADSVTLEVVATRFDTIIVRVPVTARGEYALRVRNYPAPIGHVTVAGFRAERAHHEDLACNLEVLGTAVAAVIATRRDALVKVFPGSGVIQELLPASYLQAYQFVIGRSYRPGVVLVNPGSRAYEAWDVSGAAQIQGTIPIAVTRALFQISDSVFVRSIGNFTNSQIWRNGAWVAGVTWRHGNDALGAAISPRGDIGLVMYNYSPDAGQPVFDGATGQIRYHVPLERAYYSRFSSTADTLFIAGVDAANANVLLAIDPRSGAEFARRAVDTGELIGLAVDAFNSRIFVAFQHEYRVVDIHVLDARTFEPLARMRGETPEARFFWCSQLVFDNSGIFIVDTHSTMAFDYLP